MTQQPCGHSLTAIESSEEGTNYCRQCDEEARFWDYMTALPKSTRPHGVTDARLKKARPFIMADRHFWNDIMDRHGLRDAKIEANLRHNANWDHITGNFWGMVMQTMVEHKIIKP